MKIKTRRYHFIPSREVEIKSRQYEARKRAEAGEAPLRMARVHAGAATRDTGLC